MATDVLRKNIFLSESFIKTLAKKDYEAVYLLIRILSSLRLSQKIFLNALNSKIFRNFEIIDINASLLATYSESAKAYANIISEPIYNILGIPFDEITVNIRGIYSTKKADAPIDYQIISFLRDNTAFHFFNEYIGNNSEIDGERISYIGFLDSDNDRSVILTNSIPHILEELQRIKGVKYEEKSIIYLFKDLNERIVFPFIDHIESLVHQVIDDKLIIS